MAEPEVATAGAARQVEAAPAQPPVRRLTWEERRRREKLYTFAAFALFFLLFIVLPAVIRGPQSGEAVAWVEMQNRLRFGVHGNLLEGVLTEVQVREIVRVNGTPPPASWEVQPSEEARRAWALYSTHAVARPSGRREVLCRVRHAGLGTPSVTQFTLLDPVSGRALDVDRGG